MNEKEIVINGSSLKEFVKTGDKGNLILRIPTNIDMITNNNKNNERIVFIYNRDEL